jgi:predicted short-subunit dehydrogenase-like oxidoreductase (DUF2520 family)
MINYREKIAIVGIGRLGSALAQALYRENYSIDGLIDQNLFRAEQISNLVKAEICSKEIFDLRTVDIIFICVPDDLFDAVVSRLKNQFKRNSISKFVFHCSGALTSDVFDPLRKYGIACASLHPIQTFAGREDDWQKLNNIYFGVEGDSEAIKKASEIIDKLKSNKIIIPKEVKSLYHLACTIASNYLISLVISTVDIFKKMNFSEPEILKMLHPLLSTTLSNLTEKGVDGALTGPISRGDSATIKKHIETLSHNLPFYESIYKLHGKILLSLKSVRDTISDEKYKELMKLLNGKGLEYE